jgi:hypothetical protein
VIRLLRRRRTVTLEDQAQLAVDYITGPLYPYRICWFSLKATVKDRHLCSHRFIMLPTHAAHLTGADLRTYLTEHIAESTHVSTCENVR